MNPQELLAERHRDYRKAQERHARALERVASAGEHVQALERELADAEDEDRRLLGEALVDGRKAPASKAARVRAALAKARSEHEALAYAAERAGQTLDNMPRAQKSEWLRQAQREFEAARSDYEQVLEKLAQARERLVEEAGVINFLTGGQAVHFGSQLPVHASGVEG